jgi:hypothetical protein
LRDFIVIEKHGGENIDISNVSIIYPGNLYDLFIN